MNTKSQTAGKTATKRTITFIIDGERHLDDMNHK